MTEYYLNPAATGNDDGSTKTDAWTTLQRAVDGTDGDKPGAGDVVLATGTENVTAVTDSDGNSGDLTSGNVTYRGVNPLWVNDGTRYRMNAGGNNIDILRLSSDFVCFENFELYNTSKTSGNNGLVINSYENIIANSIVNCILRDTYRGFEGWNGSVRSLKLIGCKIYDNTDTGFYIGSANNLMIALCNVYNNSRGLYVGFGDDITVANSIIRDNTNQGVRVSAVHHMITMLNVVLHANGDSIESDSRTVTIIGGRITDNTVGIDSNGITDLIATYMPDTGEDLANTTKTTGVVNELVLKGVNTNDLSGTDTDGGYEDSSTDDYNLTDTASLRRVSIDLDG